jgi:hypothetical protein
MNTHIDSIPLPEGLLAGAMEGGVVLEQPGVVQFEPVTAPLAVVPLDEVVIAGDLIVIIDPIAEITLPPNLFAVAHVPRVDDAVEDLSGLIADLQMQM